MKGPLCAIAVLASIAAGCASSQTAARERNFSWSEGPIEVRLGRVLTAERSSQTGLINLITGAPPPAGFQRPYGVAWDGEDLLIADPDANQVLRVDARGRVSRSETLDAPTGVAACAGEIFVTEPKSGRVVALTHGLRVKHVMARDLERPTGAACHGDELLIVETAAHRIAVIAADGSRSLLGTRGDAAGEFNFPTALAVAGEDAFVGDTLNFRIQRLDLRTGSPTASFGALGDDAGDMPRLKGIAVESGRIWVSDAHLDQLSLFDRDGHLLASMGQHGMGPGEFSFPSGLAVSAAGRLAVADSLNRRVQVFRIEERLR